MSRRRKPLAARTKKLYAATLARAFGDAEPSFVPDLDRDGEPWPESTRETLRAAIQRHWANRGDVARGEHIAEGIEPVYAKTRAKVWPTEPESRAFQKALAKFEPRIRSVIRVGLGLGLRSEGLLETSRPAVLAAVRFGRLTVEEKGRKERVLNIEGVKDSFEEMLALPAHPPHKKDDAARYDLSQWARVGQLLAGPDSTLNTQRNMLSRHIKAVARAAGLDSSVWTPHTLRHVFATRMHRDGAPLAVIQQAMGHESVETTVGYIATTPEDVAKYMRRIR